MIELTAELEAALAAGDAVVALESSIVAHGLPHPANLETALGLEAAIRGRGAIPATIGLVRGRAVVGLDASEIEHLASPTEQHAKAGVRDLAALITGGASAGTTVSATAALAARAGIRVFATGGIGGVHRGDASDVSSDLHALSTTPIVVVCSGPKSILDVPRTMEALESLAVLVLGFGCDVLPTFYTRDSDIEIEHRVETAEQVARIARLRFDELGHGGVLVVNPVPAADEIKADVIEPVIAQALRDAAARRGSDRVVGKAITPFLLAAVRRQLGERAVSCNRALVRSNAEVAADIACAFSQR